MTTNLQPTGKDFGRMMEMLMGFFTTQIAAALANYSIADHLAKGSALQMRLRRRNRSIRKLLSGYSGLVPRSDWSLTMEPDLQQRRCWALCKEIFPVLC
jgi:hypothetical protein